MSIQEYNDDKFPISQFVIRENKDDHYRIMILNTALKDYKYKHEFPFHLWINIEIKQVFGTFNMPTNEEAIILNQLEDEILEQLKKELFVHFIGRFTDNGFRSLEIYVNDPEKADMVIKEISINYPIREFEYLIKKDPNWKAVDGYFNY